MQIPPLACALRTFYVRFVNMHPPITQEIEMAAYETTRHHAATGSAARIGSMFTTAVGAFAAWNDTRQTRKALASLTDRELDDIGLHRGDIDAVTRRF